MSSPADCDSYCKASKGKLKMNMKKYCRKDYGKQGAKGLLRGGSQVTHITKSLGSMKSLAPSVSKILPTEPCTGASGSGVGVGHQGWDSYPGLS